MMDNATENTKFQQPMDVAEYLFCRLAQLGIKSLFGVPGDYNLVALDYVSKCGLNWVGSVNELNAGYSADGYARIVGIGALVTTFGVGELSAMNALAGSFAEFVPVVHIVGTPSTISQENGMLLHHTLGDGNFSVFANMSQSISCFTARLDRKTELIPGLIDDALRECYLQSRPVYITLPTDIVQRKVDGSRLKNPLNLEFPPNDLSKEDFVVKEILKLLQDAKRPTILIDACTIRHRAIREVRDFVKKSGFPTFVAPMGKGAVDETLPNYGGVYAGNGSHHSVRETVENSDLVFSIGAIKSDFNTTGFTYRTSQLATIDFHSTFVRVKYAEYRGVRMNGVLSKITAHIKQSDSQQIKYTSISASEVDKRDENTITHAWFWPKLTAWFEESDIVITETGTSGYGIWETKFRPGMTAISQILWGSIGYATGAAAGAAFGAEEQGKRRTILFTGDGSFQLTAQELSTMIRHKLNPIIFIICNNGFTIERFIHGMEATYNDIALWKHKELLSAFGARPEEYQWYSISTRPEVEALLANQEFALSSKLRLVEIKMDADDAPLPLKLTAAASAESNAKQ